MNKMCITSFLTANEACRLENFLFLLLLASQVGKRVNDDTKDEVEHNDDDHEEEEQVVDHPGCKQRLLARTEIQTDFEELRTRFNAGDAVSFLWVCRAFGYTRAVQTKAE